MKFSKFNKAYNRFMKLIMEDSDSSFDKEKALQELHRRLDEAQSFEDVINVYFDFFENQGFELSFVKNGWKRDREAYDTAYVEVGKKLIDTEFEASDYLLEIFKDYRKSHALYTLIDNADRYAKRNRITDFFMKNIDEKLVKFIKEKLFTNVKTRKEAIDLADKLSFDYPGLHNSDTFKSIIDSFSAADDENWAKTVEITDEIRKKWFKNYGTMNGWGEKTSYEYDIASILHDRDVKEHPELHKNDDHNLGRCYNSYGCKCGLSYSVDSSD